FIIIRIILESLNDGTHRHSRIIYNDVGFLIQGLSCPVNTNAGTYGIHIRDLMSHNHYLILAHHKFSEGMGFYTGLYTGALAHLLRFTTEISHLIPVLDHHLVTAAPQSQVNGNTGIFVILGVTGGVNANTDADGHRHVISYIDSLYILQDIKPFFL